MFYIFLLFLCGAFFKSIVWAFSNIAQGATPVVVLAFLIACALILYKYFAQIKKSSACLFKCKFNSSAAILFLITLFLSVVTFNRIHFLQLDLTLFLVATYALYGFFVDHTSSWKKNLPIAILIALCFSIFIEFGSGFGFFLRIASSQLVESLLKVIGINVVSSHDILILDNSIAHIDTPCSGLKSLLTGTLFFLVAAYIRKRTIDFVFLIYYGVFCAVLLSANVTRILLLVITHDVLGFTRVADTIHLPLGMMGFGISCVIGWFLLGLEWRNSKEKQTVSENTSHNHTGLLSIAVIAALSTTIALKGLPEQSHTGDAMNDTVLLEKINAKPLPLTAVENQFFAAKENSSASKWKFDYNGIKGSLLIVESSALNGMHSPEICFMGSGMKINSTKEERIGNINCTVINLNNNRQTAAYWMQHNNTTTSCFLNRFWEHIVYGKKLWTMKVVLLDSHKNIERQAFEKIIYTAFDLKKKN